MPRTTVDHQRHADDRAANGNGQHRLQQVQRADQVGLQQIIRCAIETGLHGSLGGAIDEQIEGRKPVEIVSIADVTVNERHARFSKARQVLLGAAPLQIIESRDLHRLELRLEHDGQIRAHEAGPARNQDRTE